MAGCFYGARVLKMAHYLFFTSECEQALELYARCGLGQIVEVKRHEAGAMRGKIMHAKFEGPGVSFYASDNDDAEPMRGFAQYVLVEDRERMEKLFAALAEGGTVTTGLGMQPWGYYGKLTDRFGVQWMMLVGS
jgi:PhnB protein